MLEKYLPRADFVSYEDFKENFTINVPDNFNFAFDVMDEWAGQEPSRTALVWCDESGNEREFTYGELKKYSDKTANILKSMGIRKGDAVMLMLKRRYEFWFCILALHKIGAPAIPATHLLTAKDIAYRNKAADIKMVIALNQDDIIDHVDEAQRSSPSLKIKMSVGGARDGWVDYDGEMEKASDDFPRPAGADSTVNEDMLLLYFTSGTTAMPKMAMHDYTYPLGHIITSKYWQNVEKRGLHLTVADTGWAKAAWGKLYGQWLCDCAVFVYDYDRFVPKNLLDVIVKYGVTSFCAPPTIFRYLIKEDLSKYDLSGLKHCTVAGEPLNPEVYQQFLRMTGLKLMEGYGQTETVVQVATFPGMTPRPGSMGKPSPGYDIDIVNENLESCKTGEEGQIVIRLNRGKPWGMFGGYYRDPGLTKQVWHDDIYFTGDMAWRDEDGFFWFVGRADDLIKSSGYRIGPFEVESALHEHPAVLECAVTAVPDPDRGQIVKATVVLAQGYSPDEKLKADLQQHTKQVTAPYKYPRIIEFATELPKTISGKIRRVEIREEGSG